MCSNFLSSYLYNIFTMHFPSSSPLLKSLFSVMSNFSCCLTSTFNLPSNFATTSFTFSKSFFLSKLLCSAVNFFYYTKYFVISLTFLLFNILSIFYSLTSSTSIGFTVIRRDVNRLWIGLGLAGHR